MHLGGVPIDSRSALGAEVAVTGVEIECPDAVFAASTLELYSPLYPICSEVCHRLILVLRSGGRMHHGGLSKVTESLHTRLRPNSKSTHLHSASAEQRYPVQHDFMDDVGGALFGGLFPFSPHSFDPAQSSPYTWRVITLATPPWWEQVPRRLLLKL